MGIFGKKPVPGISNYELNKLHHGRLKAELDSVFPTSFSSSNKHKREALHTALGMGMDQDPNMPRKQGGVIQREEFEAAISGYTPKEVEKLRKIAEKYLKD